MSTKQFTKDWRFLQLVRIATKRKLTYKNAIAFIKKNGFPKISEKTYQRAKTELNASKDLKDIATDGFDEYSLDAIITTAAVDAELWDMVRNEPDPWVKLRAIKMIIENCPKKSEDFESGKALAYVSSELEAAKNKNKEPGKTEVVKDESGKTDMVEVEFEDKVKEGENVEKDLESGSN